MYIAQIPGLCRDLSYTYGFPEQTYDFPVQTWETFSSRGGGCKCVIQRSEIIFVSHPTLHTHVKIIPPNAAQSSNNEFFKRANT